MNIIFRFFVLIRDAHRHRQADRKRFADRYITKHYLDSLDAQQRRRLMWSPYE